MRNKFRFHFAKMDHDIENLSPNLKDFIQKFEEFVNVQEYFDEIKKINDEQNRFSSELKSTDSARENTIDFALNHENITFLSILSIKIVPEDGPYKNLSIPVDLLFCSKYPTFPPYIFTPLYHPAVYQCRMCLLRENWTSAISLEEILLQIQISLNEPLFTEESFNEEVYETYQKGHENDSIFHQKVLNSLQNDFANFNIHKK